MRLLATVHRDRTGRDVRARGSGAVTALGGSECNVEEMTARDEVVGLHMLMLMLMRRRQAAETAGEREG